MYKYHQNLHKLKHFASEMFGLKMTHTGKVTNLNETIQSMNGVLHIDNKYELYVSYFRQMH